MKISEESSLGVPGVPGVLAVSLSVGGTEPRRRRGGVRLMLNRLN
jgi:hypothetical protein